MLLCRDCNNTFCMYHKDGKYFIDQECCYNHEAKDILNESNNNMQQLKFNLEEMAIEEIAQNIVDNKIPKTDLIDFYKDKNVFYMMELYLYTQKIIAENDLYKSNANIISNI